MTRAPKSARPDLEDRFPTRGVSPLETLTDLQTLERLLAHSLGRQAAKSAAILQRRFGALSAILTADLACVASMIGETAARDLRLVHDMACRLAAAEVTRRCVVSSWSALSAYLKVSMAHLEREAFRVLFLDKKNQLIADEVMGQGSVDHAPVYPREVMRRALELSASALILVHNHPSGDPTPSTADIEVTRQVIDAGKALRIAIHDHVVVGSQGIASFKALGLI